MWDSTRKLTVKMPWSQKLTHAEVTELYVRPGDRVEIDDPVLGLATESGRQIVHAAHRGRLVPLVATGDRVDQGEPLYILRLEGATAAQANRNQRVSLESAPVPDRERPPTDWLDLFENFRGWAWFMLACGIYVLAARFVIPYLAVWYPGTSAMDWLKIAIGLSLGGAGLFIALSFRGSLLARRFTMGLAVCWTFLTVGGIEVKTGFTSALLGSATMTDHLASAEDDAPAPDPVQMAELNPPEAPVATTGNAAERAVDLDKATLAEVHPPFVQTSPPAARLAATPTVTAAPAIAETPSLAENASGPSPVAVGVATEPAAALSSASDDLLVPYPVPRPTPVVHASLATIAPPEASPKLTAPTLATYATPSLFASPAGAESPAAPQITLMNRPAMGILEVAQITPVKASLALPARPERSATPPRRTLVASLADAPQHDSTPAKVDQSDKPAKPGGPVELAALDTEIGPLPWIRPRFTELSLLFQYLEDPRDPVSPTIGVPYAADLPPEVAMAVTSQNVTATRSVLQVTGWCIAAHDRSGLKRITTDPDLYRRFAVSDRMQLVVVDLKIESDTVAMLADALPVFGDEDPGFFHNRRPVMGGFSGPALLQLGEDWLGARSNRRMDPNYPDVETGGSFYFETDQLLAALKTQGCTDPIWQGGAPATPLGEALDAALRQ